MRPAISSIGPEIFLSQGARLIAFTGAGGKTSLIRCLATHLETHLQRVITTTTTKIFPVPGAHTVLQDDAPDFAGRIRHALSSSLHIVVARRFDLASGKLIGLDKDTVTALHEAKLEATILVEADGAARKPLKAPASHEPVIPQGTDFCVGVMGLDAVSCRLVESNVHRHEIFSRITGLAPSHFVSPSHMTRLALAPDGLFKGCPVQCNRFVFLNKIDIPGGYGMAEEFSDMLTQNVQAADFQWVAGSTRFQRFTRIVRKTRKAWFLTCNELVCS